jgi:hypothetical protein
MTGDRYAGIPQAINPARSRRNKPINHQSRPRLIQGKSLVGKIPEILHQIAWHLSRTRSSASKLPDLIRWAKKCLNFGLRHMKIPALTTLRRCPAVVTADVSSQVILIVRQTLLEVVGVSQAF